MTTEQASGTDLHTRIREALEERIRLATACLAEVGGTRAGETYPDGSGVAERGDGPSYPWGVGEAELAYIAANDPASTIRRAERDLRTLDRHAAVLENVEWPHDQTGRGKAYVCAYCHPKDPTDWHPAIGEAGVLPDGFVPSYVLAPCVEVRELAAGEGLEP